MGFHGAERTPEGGGGLLVGEPFGVAQVQRSKSRVSNGLSCERKSGIFEQVIE